MDIRDMDEAGDAQGAIAEARVGRFSALANELQTAGVHAAIVEWVRAGCQKTKRKLPGRPGRDPHIELMVDVEYRHYRDMVPPEDLSEKALELTISEANNNLNVREIRRIVAERLAKNISGLATKLGISKAEAKRILDERREQAWQRWREWSPESDADEGAGPSGG